MKKKCKTVSNEHLWKSLQFQFFIRILVKMKTLGRTGPTFTCIIDHCVGTFPHPSQDYMYFPSKIFLEEKYEAKLEFPGGDRVHTVK